MSRRLFLAISFAILSSQSCAWARHKIPTTTVCSVVKNPAVFDNQLVRFRATLVGNFEISAIQDPDDEKCGSLWFTYPGSGPEAMVSLSILTPQEKRPAVQLKRNGQFKKFQKLVDAKMYPRNDRNICEGCSRYRVTAIMVGLVEFAGRGRGFGHMNAFPVQFVLRSVEQTSVEDLAANYNPGEFSTTPIRFPTGYISGILIDPEGRPVANGDLDIYLAADPSANVDNDSATTDGKGRFKFAVRPGDYFIGFNTFWPPSAQFPFPPTYYPSAPQLSSAKAVSVADRQHVHNLILKLPERLVPRAIRVKVVWPDGKPVADANVWLSEVSDPTSVVGFSVSHTVADGTYNLLGLEGIDYILHADKYAGLGQASCAKNVLIRATTPVVTPIRLALTRSDYNICKNIDFEVPVEATTGKRN